MPVGADDHGRFLHLLWVICLHNVYDIEASQGCKTILPLYARTLALDFARYVSSQLLEFLGISERFRGKPAQNHIRCHVAPPCRSCCLSGCTGADSFATVCSCYHSSSRDE